MAIHVLSGVAGLGKMYTMSEVDLQLQLDVLFKRSLHKLAVELATAHSADSSAIAIIHQRWGDHLYAKGEFDSSMAQYLHTIGDDLTDLFIRLFSAITIMCFYIYLQFAL